MTGLVGLLLFGILLGGFLLAQLAPYKLVKGTRYQVAIRSWLVVSSVEISWLLFMPEVQLPLLHLQFEVGWKYLVGSTVGLAELLPQLAAGHRPDVVLVLIPPLLGALIGLRYDRQRYRTHLRDNASHSEN
ncbi:MAG: hypothetical protein EOO61_21950 [Hymenobacter sp.]|nr:MAG: hypothetical protein EOO61_21950 [Hymenobacter sp.]